MPPSLQIEMLLILVLVRPASYGGPEELLHEACFTWAGTRELGQEVSSPIAALLRNPWRKEKAASVRPVLDIYSASGMPLASLLVSTFGLPWGWGLGSTSVSQDSLMNFFSSTVEEWASGVPGLVS